MNGKGVGNAEMEVFFKIEPPFGLLVPCVQSAVDGYPWGVSLSPL